MHRQHGDDEDVVLKEEPPSFEAWKAKRVFYQSKVSTNKFEVSLVVAPGSQMSHCLQDTWENHWENHPELALEKLEK